MLNVPPSSLIVDPQAIASSQLLGWEPIVVEEYRLPPGGLEMPAWDTHAIAVSLAARPHRIHQMVGDRRYTGLYRKGDISVTPAGIPCSYQSEGDDHYLNIQIPPQFLQRVAREAIEINPDRIELVTEFRDRHLPLEQIAMLLRSELHQGGRAGRLYVESLATAMAVHLLRDYATTQPRVALCEGGLGDRKLLQVADYVHAHLDQDIKLADLAELVGISQFHFSRLFKQSVGQSPHQYVLQQRIDRAKQMLDQTNQSVIDIALACGFSSHSHFSQQFKQLVGLTPRAFRSR